MAFLEHKVVKKAKKHTKVIIVEKVVKATWKFNVFACRNKNNK